MLWRRLAWSDAPPIRTPLRRELGLLAGAVVALAAFIAGGLLWHRPMARLAGAEPAAVVFDMHSHTNVSHDVQGTLMRGFDTEAARRWHGRAGFDAFFVTDHNTVAGLSHAAGEPVALPRHRGQRVEGSRRPAGRLAAGRSVPVQRIPGRAPHAAGHQRHRLRRAQRAVAARVRAQPPDSAGFADRGRRRRSRDRERLARGQRDRRARVAIR